MNKKCVTQGNHKEAGNMGLPMHWLPSVEKVWLRREKVQKYKG
jgi:hypothetical protein